MPSLDFSQNKRHCQGQNVLLTNQNNFVSQEVCINNKNIKRAFIIAKEKSALVCDKLILYKSLFSLSIIRLLHTLNVVLRIIERKNVLLNQIDQENAASFFSAFSNNKITL